MSDCRACENETYAEFINRTYKSKGYKVVLGEKPEPHTCTHFVTWIEGNPSLGISRNGTIAKLSARLDGPFRACVKQHYFQLLLPVKCTLEIPSDELDENRTLEILQDGRFANAA